MYMKEKRGGAFLFLHKGLLLCVNKQKEERDLLSMKKIIGLLVFTWSLLSPLVAQNVTVQGHLLGAGNEHLAAATVRCYQDTSFIKGTTTNSKGEFELKQLQIGKKYRLRFNYVGYKELSMILNPTKEKLIRLGDITMNNEAQQMQEVTVLAENQVQTEDKLMVFPTKEQIRHAYDGFGALNTLMIPALNVSGTSISYMGQSVFLCINGREATQEEVQNLFPKDIKRVDLYPQGRPDYPEASVLIDYVTKERDYAGSVAMSGGQSLNMPKGAFRATAQYFEGKSELAFSASDNYQHFTSHPEGNTHTTYTFPDETITRTDETLSSARDNNRLKMYANYIYRGAEQDFYASLRFNRDASEDDDFDRQSYSNEAGKLMKRENSRSQDINPALQLRYNVKLPHGQRLRTELYGSYGNNDYHRWYEQHRDEDFVSSYRNATDETSWYGKAKVNYTKTFKNKSSLNLELTEDLTHTKNLNTRAETLSEISLNKSNTRIYATYNYRIKNKLNLQVRLAEHLSYTDAGNENIFSTFFIPSFKVSYRNKKHSVSLEGSLSSAEPSNANRTGDEYKRNEYEMFVGNPELEDYLACNGVMRYNWSINPKWSFFAIANYYISTKQVYSDYRYDKEREMYVYQQLNGGRSWKMHLEAGTQYIIIPQRLNAQVLFLYNHADLKLWKRFVCDGPFAAGGITYFYKGWGFWMGCVTKFKYMSQTSGAIYHEPLEFDFQVNYNLGNWHFELKTKNLGLKSYSHQRMQREGYVQGYSTRVPRISDNIVNLTVNYRFTFGKKKHKFDNTEVEDVNKSTISK